MCGKNFGRVSSKTRHLKEFHNIITNTLRKHIKCPICCENNKKPFQFRKELIHHLKQYHTLNIVETTLDFKTIEEFEAWRNLDNRNIDYVCEKNCKTNYGEQRHYNCNRSNTTGWLLINVF